MTAADQTMPLLDRFDWDGAACRGDRVSDWTADVASERARQMCHGCPIRDQCLSYALAADEEHGLWGGLDRVEREEYRRELLARLGPDDPVVRFLKRIVWQRQLELCPVCRMRYMLKDNRRCPVCTERHEEGRLASKRRYIKHRDELPVGASATERAMAWLKIELRDGPQDSAALKAKAANAGIASSTLGRARERIGTHTHSEWTGSGRRSTWMLEKDANRETEHATCEECSAPFIRDVVRHGRPQRLCSDTCRRARTRRRERARDGSVTLTELQDRHRARGANG